MALIRACIKANTGGRPTSTTASGIKKALGLHQQTAVYNYASLRWVKLEVRIGQPLRETSRIMIAQ